MKSFVDASILVAILAEERDASAWVAEISRLEERPLWSAMACWEAIAGLRSSHRWSVSQARQEVEAFAQQSLFLLVQIGDVERSNALDAYMFYGKGSGHRAQLNMGDCFAYACAKTNNARLLYKGDDFIHTDLA